MKKSIIILFLACLVFSGLAYAAPPPSYSDSMGRLNTFMTNVGAVLNNILVDPSLTGFVNALWNTLTVVLIVTVLAKYSMTGISTFELIHPLLLILITRLMLNHYDYLTGLCWDWSEGIAGGIQRAVIGNSDPFLLPGFINDVVSGIETSDVSIWDGVKLFLAGNVILASIFLLTALAFLANTWALWGYALAKIIGWFFIPFIMFKRLSFLFDGWMRLFLGFLIYGIIARANLLLTVLAIKSFFGIPGYVVNTNTSMRIDFNGVADLFGLAGFLFIAILALIATGRFATAVVSSAGGFGQSISTLAYGLTRVMRGI
jgi:hypothetical protein